MYILKIFSQKYWGGEWYVHTDEVGGFENKEDARSFAEATGVSNNSEIVKLEQSFTIEGITLKKEEGALLYKCEHDEKLTRVSFGATTAKKRTTWDVIYGQYIYPFDVFKLPSGAFLMWTGAEIKTF